MDFHPWILNINLLISSLQFPSFNVAMDFHPWIPISDSCAWISNMVGFNVAMDFHPWILHIRENYLPERTGFNVAMDFHPWILRTNSNTIINPITLQCCHGFSSMDTETKVYYYRTNRIASMLPWIFIHGYLNIMTGLWTEGISGLQCCHGFSSMDTKTLRPMMNTRRGLGFNVAMDFHPWIPETG